MKQLSRAVTGAFAAPPQRGVPGKDTGIVQKLKQGQATLMAQPLERAARPRRATFGLIASVQDRSKFTVDAFSQRAAAPDLTQNRSDPIPPKGPAASGPKFIAQGAASLVQAGGPHLIQALPFRVGWPSPSNGPRGLEGPLSEMAAGIGLAPRHPLEGVLRATFRLPHTG